MSERKLMSLKKEMDEVKESRDRARGALDNLMNQLKKEFDCDTLIDARKMLESLKTEAQGKQDNLDVLIDLVDKALG